MNSILGNLTVVVGIDQHTATLFEVAVETWKRFRPELFRCPWLVFFDSKYPGLSDGIKEYFLTEHKISPTLIPGSYKPFYESQREFMLTGWIYAPAKHVQTKWFMKIDCDVLALDDRPLNEWLRPEWFATDPVMIASPWGYTKAKGDGGTIHDWADKLERWGDFILPDYERLGLANRIKGDKIKYPRICSWLSYYRTDWYKELAASCRLWAGGKLPVPSQDTAAWYLAERLGSNVVRANQKRRGWSTVSSLEKLKQKASEVLR